MLFFNMAWRNVWRNRRRSLLTIMAISLGLGFNIFMRAIGDGFHEQMVDNSVRSHIGHLEVHLRSYSLRVVGDGLASTAENSAGVAIVGIDPAQERTVTTIDHGIVKGEYLREGMVRPIVIGDRLAVNLKAELGDKVVLLVQAADGSMGANLFRVVGIFRSGAPELDSGMAFILRQDAQELFSLQNRVTEAVVLLNSSRAVPAAQQALQSELSGKQFEVLTWYQVEPFLLQFIQLDDAFFYIIVVFFFVVISIGILNTIMMSVFERVREFGVMMALGTKPRQIIKLVVEEAFVLAVVGALIGSAIGISASVYFAAEGMNLAAWAEGAAALGMTSTVVYTKLTAANVVLSNLAVVAVVVLVGLYPAMHASRLRPVEAIRHV
jgi:putative ABC transport system permease protein